MSLICTGPDCFFLSFKPEEKVKHHTRLALGMPRASSSCLQQSRAALVPIRTIFGWPMRDQNVRIQRDPQTWRMTVGGKQDAKVPPWQSKCNGEQRSTTLHHYGNIQILKMKGPRKITRRLFGSSPHLRRVYIDILNRAYQQYQHLHTRWQYLRV